MTLFRGQTVSAGHFLQPTAKAIGHRVISLPPLLSVWVGNPHRVFNAVLIDLNRLHLPFSRPSLGARGWASFIRMALCVRMVEIYCYCCRRCSSSRGLLLIFECPGARRLVP